MIETIWILDIIGQHYCGLSDKEQYIYKELPSAAEIEKHIRDCKAEWDQNWNRIYKSNDSQTTIESDIKVYAKLERRYHVPGLGEE